MLRVAVGKQRDSMFGVLPKMPFSYYKKLSLRAALVWQYVAVK